MIVTDRIDTQVKGLCGGGNKTKKKRKRKTREEKGREEKKREGKIFMTARKREKERTRI